MILIYTAKDTEHNEAVVLHTIFKKKGGRMTIPVAADDGTMITDLANFDLAD